MVIASIDDYRIACKARLPRFLYDYISGGSYQENTLRANIADLQATLLRQRVMVDESHLNLSNHGGRQLDSVTSTVRALPKIVDAVQGKVPVFMDGGIRSGLDVLKALALGAKACFVGRAWAYALGAAGEGGVRNMLEILAEELRVGMILTGCSDASRAASDLLLKDS
jgi:L-lactate dehydrogenase (cytochrome)